MGASVGSAGWVWFFQSGRWSFVIQYAKGVMKKFQGSRVAILKSQILKILFRELTFPEFDMFSQILYKRVIKAKDLQLAVVIL